MKKLLDEFKTFISKGNVLGLAIGIIIGGAFNDIVNSLINDVKSLIEISKSLYGYSSDFCSIFFLISIIDEKWSSVWDNKDFK